MICIEHSYIAENTDIKQVLAWGSLGARGPACTIDLKTTHKIKACLQRTNDRHNLKDLLMIGWLLNDETS